MDARKLVAWNLRRLRVDRGLAQEALAVDAEIDRTYVSRLERNMENPTVAVLERLAHALDVEIIDFFVVPKAGAKPPQVLAKGRHPSRERTKSGINK
jgi:transcriptional regulator with XRE-family HTH domain